MKLFLKLVKVAMRWPFMHKFWSASLIVLLAGAGTFLAFSQTTPPNIKAITLSQDPLYTSVAADKPTLTLVLSHEYSIVAPQYKDTEYDVAKDYLGYFNAFSCYTYNYSPTGVPQGGTAEDYKRFVMAGPATQKKCANAFSGNFLNFASSSSMDIIRMALTGGDRWIDEGSNTGSLTILQRAVLPNFSDMCYWGRSQFSKKSIRPDDGNYLGAVPTAMRTAAGNKHIVIGNRDNRIVFGVSSSTQAGVLEWPELETTRLHVTLPEPKTIAQFARCGNQEYYSLARTSGLAGSDNTSAVNNMFVNMFFYARVQVCDTDASKVLQDVRDYNFCTQQPNGYYKPTGSIQKYSEEMRLAVFGYWLDKEFDRYGGVLRAPMKYVGANTFDINGINNGTGNPNREWDANTGVFIQNPDNDATQAIPISGVVNYINRFNRGAGDRGGVSFKWREASGELYGEALRYLQGHQPTPAAIWPLGQGVPVPASYYDKFPVYTTWTDPYGGGRLASDDYACSRANIAMIADSVGWDRPAVWNYEPAARPESNLQNFTYWLDTVRNFEEDGTGIYPYPYNPLPKTYIDSQGDERVIRSYNPINTAMLSFASGYFSILPGMAYWARSQDIRGTAWTDEPTKQRPGLRVKSFFFDVATNSAIAGREEVPATESYRKFENSLFRAAKYGGYETDPENALGAPYNKFGNPFLRQDGTQDNNVWQDPARPGEASTFYFLRDSAETTIDVKTTLSNFDNIFSRAKGRVASRSFAKGTVSNKTVSANGLVYQAKFDTGTWTGDVQATALTLTGTSTVSISTTPTFTVAAQLAARPASSPRNIVIGKLAPELNSAATNFTWASLETTMQTHLKKLTPTSPADSDATGEDRVKYLKGDRSKEGATFRTRTQVLGDIVNSGIVYSGTPTLNITPRTEAYQSFFDGNKDRTPAIFVGANDGMLHAFNATNGDELFGYIPSWMGPKLASLTASTYTSNHQAYVDATPAVAEAQVGATGGAADWKTVLVGGTGAGGPGVYALDVTNPAAFDATKVLWEFTKRDDADMGYVVGSPKIIKVRTSAAGTVPATYRWLAVVASGVNNYLPYPDASGTYSAAGNPALFFLALDKPAGTTWTLGTNYYKLSVPVDTTLNAANAPGLINFQAILGPVGELAQIYMGDLHGKVWKLDFTTLATSSWTFDALSYYKYNAEACPMYIAKTAGGAVQPITMAPLIVSAATSGGRRTSYVAFGTGKHLEQSDTTSTLQNSFYTLYDDGTTSATGGSEIPGRGRLMLGTAATSGALSTVSTAPFKWGRPTADSTDVTGNPIRAGWYFDFTSATEKSIVGASIIGDKLLFGSLIPATAVVASSCRGGGGGGGTTYNVNIDAGNGTFAASDVGLLSEALTLEIPGADGVSGTGRRTKTATQLRVNMGSNGAREDAASKATITSVSGRLSWRQINNYQDLKNAQ